MENIQIKVSVIIPMYKCSEYVDDLLHSMRNQTLKEIEIICVLDGEDKEISNIIDKHISVDSRISYIIQEHSNAGEARNKGLKIAKGEYLSFLDADDLFNPKLLEKLYNKAKDNDADISMCSANEINFWKGETTSFNDKYAEFDENTVIDPNNIDNLYVLAKSVLWNKMFKKEFIEEKKLYFTNTHITNDLLFVYSALTCSKRITVIKEVLVTRRKYHNENSISSNRCIYSEESIYVFETLQKWLKDNGYWKRRKKDFIEKFKGDVSYHASYGYNKKFVDALVKYIATKSPWKYMCNAELVNALNLHVNKLKKQRQKLKDDMIILKKENDPFQKKKYEFISNIIANYEEIYNETKKQYGRNLKKRSNPISWFIWSINFRGLKETLHKIKDFIFKEEEINVDTICSGFITNDRHNLSFALPYKTYRKTAKVIDLEISVRSNGYYPVTSSRKNKKDVMKLGTHIIPIIKNGKTIRQDDFTRVYADISNGIGIKFVIPFYNQLFKDTKGNIADNNMPAAVCVKGKIKLK